VNTKNFSLRSLIESGAEGYKLRLVYSIEIDHQLMGTFPVVIKETGKQVLTTSREMLIEVWKSLPPRKSKIVTHLFYCNDESSIGYHVSGISVSDLNLSEPMFIFSGEELELRIILQKTDGKPGFAWSSGIFGAHQSEDEFFRMIELAKKV